MWQILGKRLGKGMGAAAEAIKKLTTADIIAYEASGTLEIGDLQLREGDLKVGHSGPCAVSEDACLHHGGKV